MYVIHFTYPVLTYLLKRVCYIGELGERRLFSIKNVLHTHVCILPIMLYGSECWALSKADARKVDGSVVPEEDP